MSSGNLQRNCLREQDAKQNEVASTELTPIHASMQDLKNGFWFTSPKHGMPGTITNVKMSKTGKHGHAKFTFNVAYPFTGQNSQEMHPGHTHLTRPTCIKYEAMVVDFEEGNISAINADNAEVTLYLAPDFQPKNSDNPHSGPQFIEDWERSQDEDKEMIINILRGPVKDKKGDFYVHQVMSWKLTDPQDE
jgi:translation elongation factor P/translation initiation factor 5A